MLKSGDLDGVWDNKGSHSLFNRHDVFDWNNNISDPA